MPTNSAGDASFVTAAAAIFARSSELPPPEPHDASSGNRTGDLGSPARDVFVGLGGDLGEDLDRAACRPQRIGDDAHEPGVVQVRVGDDHNVP